MASQQLLIDTVSNNLANINTTGFKKQRVQFQDLFYANIPMGLDAQASVGNGSRTVATQRMWSQGNIEQTGDPLNVAIEGEGLFAVETSRGQAYTRDGSFRLDGEGHLVTSAGYRVSSGEGIQIPAGATELAILEDGSVIGVTNGTFQVFGTLTLSLFQNPSGLDAIGGNLYLATRASGEAAEFTPGSDGAGILRGSYLETSNVDIVSEMVNLIVAQRAFELNSKAVETADQMWAIANNVRN